MDDGAGGHGCSMFAPFLDCAICHPLTGVTSNGLDLDVHTPLTPFPGVFLSHFRLSRQSFSAPGSYSSLNRHVGLLRKAKTPLVELS